MTLIWGSSKQRQIQPLAMEDMLLSCCAQQAKVYLTCTHTHTPAQSFHSHTRGSYTILLAKCSAFTLWPAFNLSLFILAGLAAWILSALICLLHR